MLLCAVARSLWVRGHPCRALSLLAPPSGEQCSTGFQPVSTVHCRWTLTPQRLPTPLRPARSRRAKYRLEACATLLFGLLRRPALPLAAVAEPKGYRKRSTRLIIWAASIYLAILLNFWYLLKIPQFSLSLSIPTRHYHDIRSS